MDPDWPAWATEVVEVAEPDPAWAALARALVADLEARLRPWLDGAGVEHVGSTAVPGLAAKPVVDLMAPVRSLTACAHADAALAEAGWALVPPALDQRPWRRFYVLPDGARRVAHLHLVERDSPHWRDARAFRDALRAHPALARAYERVKREAARSHPDDREAYTAAKTDFVRSVLA